MKKMINNTRIVGRLYQHNLALRVSSPQSKTPGTEYISGTVDIATDEEGINIVSVHFSFVTALTKDKKPNNTFVVLKNIIDHFYKSIMADGFEEASKFRIDSAIGLNEFYTDRNGKEELVSAKRNEGGFIHYINSLDNEPVNSRNTFTCDMVITGVTTQEADPERNLPEKAIVKGAIFDFRNALLPVEFSAISPNAIAYFEGLGASSKEPVFTKIWGSQISETVVRTITEESAFGEPSVREVKSSRKDFVITGASPTPYVWDDESSITAQELVEAMTARETVLATLKQRQNEYKNSQNNAIPAATATTTSSETFNF